MKEFIQNEADKFIALEQATENEDNETHYSSSGLNPVCALYIMKHKQSGKFYVGSAEDVGYRLYKHRSMLRLGKHANRNLTEVYRQHTEFSYYIAITENREEAFELEQHLLNRYWGDSRLLNIARDARTVRLGAKVSQETRNKMSAAHRGKKLTQEHIEKIRAAQVGVPKPPERVEKVRLALIGRKLTPEHVAKLHAKSHLRKGIPLGADVREKIRLGSAHRSKPVVINSIRYDGIRHAARELGISRKAVKDRIHSDDLKYANWKLVE